MTCEIDTSWEDSSHLPCEYPTLLYNIMQKAGKKISVFPTASAQQEGCGQPIEMFPLSPNLLHSILALWRWTRAL